MDAISFCSDAGATDDYACDLSPAIAAYVTGTHYRFMANTANTGAATIAFNSLASPKTIVKVAGGITTALADNDILSGQWVDLVYDGTNMQMQSTLGNAPTGGGGSPGTPNFSVQYRIDATTFGGLPLSWDLAALSNTSYVPLGAPGLNDASFSGTPDTGGLNFCVQLSTTGTPDKFQWDTDGCNTLSADVSITGVAQLLSNGVSITFGATTGHTAFDKWRALTGALAANSTTFAAGVFSLPIGTSGGDLRLADGTQSSIIVNTGTDPFGGSEIKQLVSGTGVLTNDGSNSLTWQGGSAGQAACWKTNGQLSYCESVVGAMGACTCH